MRRSAATRGPLTRAGRCLAGGRSDHVASAAAMAADENIGYGTPLWKKLGLKEGFTLTLVNAPGGWAVPDLPDGVEVGDGGEVVVAFHRSAAELSSGIEGLGQAIFPAG